MGSCCHKQNHERANVSAGCRFIIAFLRLVGRSVKFRWIEAVTLVVFLLISQGFYEFTAYQVGLLSSEFYAALLSRCYEHFIWTVRFAILFVVGISMIKSVTYLVAAHLAMLLRTVVTERMHNLYFENKQFYTVANLMNLDNPDQRLTQDIGVACTLVSDILPLFMINPILVIFYTYKCVEKAGWLGPISAYVMFVVYAVITHFVTEWTSKAIYEYDRQEGNFRFFHTQVRTTAEGAAFLDVGRAEHHFATTALWRLLHAYRVNVNRKPVLYFFTTLTAYTGSVLNYLAIGIALFSGFFGNPDKTQMATIISQTSFFLLYLINKLTTLVDLANNIAQLVGVGHRVVTLEENLMKSKNLITPAAYAASEHMLPGYVEVTEIAPALTTAKIDPKMPDVVVQLSQITVALPLEPDRELIRNLSITMRLNRPLLITGPSGVGKTALLRVLAELWPSVAANGSELDSSYYYRSPRVRQILVPQRPFVPSAFACPYELFGLLDELDRETIEHTLAHGSSPSFRALHLAYLLLTAAERPPTVRTDTSCWKKGSKSFDDYWYSNAFSAEQGSSSTGRLFCGYRVDAYLEALNLLVEFHLTDAESAKHVSQQFARLLQTDDVEYRSKCQACLEKSRRDIWDICRFGCKRVVPEYDFSGGEWRNSYSPGEMQRLVLAAVCYRRPHVAFLDESTSQLNEAAQKQAYDSLRARQITPITVGHRMGLRAYHVEELRFTRLDMPMDRSDLPPHTIEASGPNWEHIIYSYSKKM